MQDLLVKVQTVDADFVLFPLAAGAHLPRLQHRLRLDDVAGRLERHVLLAVAVEHAEEVVVAAGHDRAVVAVPAALELVEDAVVLVQRAQLRAEVLVDLRGGRVGTGVDRWLVILISGDPANTRGLAVKLW